MYREYPTVGLDGSFDLTAPTAGATLVRYHAHPSRGIEVRGPVWSLSVEDPLPWRRLYSATSAVLTLEWSRKCAACSSGSGIWRQNSAGFRPRMMLLLRSLATMLSVACRSASRLSPEQSARKIPGTSPRGVPRYLPRHTCICAPDRGFFYAFFQDSPTRPHPLNRRAFWRASRLFAVDSREGAFQCT